MHKLIEVLKVTDLTHEDMVDRELALIKVTADSHNRSEILQIVDIFRAKIVDVSEQSVIVEVTGDEGKIDAMVRLLRPHGIKELARTGRIALARGDTAGAGVEGRFGHRLRRTASRNLPGARQQPGSGPREGRPFELSKGLPAWSRCSQTGFLMNILYGKGRVGMAKMYYDSDADLSYLQGQEAWPSSATAARATPTR